MKNLLTLESMMLLYCVETSAQLTVFDNGHVNAGGSQATSEVRLSVGDSVYKDTNYNVYFSSVNPSTSKYNIAAEGISLASQTGASGVTVGVRGVAGNGKSGCNYGVIGSLVGKQDGAGIVGGCSSDLSLSLKGRYAGYFSGDVLSTGALSGHLVNEYDSYEAKRGVPREITHALSLLDSIAPITYRENEKLQTNVLGDYEAQGFVPSFPDRDTGLSTVPQRYALDRDNVAKFLPSVILTGMNGKNVDYTQLIPILIQSIKDLKAEVDELRAANASLSTQTRRSARATDTAGMTDGVSASGNNKLYQNVPNPADGQTTVRFSLDSSASDASIAIFKADGTLVGQVPVDKSMTEVSIDTASLQPDIYLYSLIVNGQRIDTRRMVVR